MQNAAYPAAMAMSTRNVVVPASLSIRKVDVKDSAMANGPTCGLCAHGCDSSSWLTLRNDDEIYGQRIQVRSIQACLF